MKITSSGQISLPADVRQRWGVSRARVIDFGDHIEVHPMPDDVVAATVGAFAPTVVEPNASSKKLKKHSSKKKSKR